MRRMLPLVVLVVLCALAAPAWCQMGPPPGGFGGQPGMGMGMMMPGMMGMPMMPQASPPVTVVVADGVVYVACNGKLSAYEAKTLKLLAEVTFWTPPQPPMMPMGLGGPPAPGGPPPPAP